MPKFLVAVSDERHSSYEIEREILSKEDIELKICNCTNEEDVINECADVDGILLDMAPMSATVIQGLKKCKVINRYGVGYDNVDVDACIKNNIQLTNVPDYCAEDVSDQALALLFACLRQVSLRDRLVRQGQWNIQAGRSFRLEGKTLGVLGAGRIARALIRKVSGFGLKQILVYDPYVSDEVISKLGAKKAELKEVLTESDFVSLHMPVTPETRGFMNRETIGLMKPTAILINTGRGPLVDDEALLEALRENKIGFAGLDTHNSEPLPENSEFFKLDNVVLTDHTAYNTEEAVVELKTKSANNIIGLWCKKSDLNRIAKLHMV
jgi:D-3-phosphoglycerate dehydrogenase / 2-oxoglutarate reductase